MRKWFVGIALAAGFVGANAVSAQVQVQVQDKVEVQIQAKPAVQIQVGQAQAQPGVVQGKAIRIMPGGPMAPAVYQPTRLTQADAIFVGRVVAFEPMDIEASPAPGQPKVKYRIAVVQVSDPIFGVKKGQETVRVGFITQGDVPANGGGVQILPAIQPGQIQIQPFPGGGRRAFPFNPQVNLDMGTDGMFIVNKHHQEKFFLAPQANSFVNRTNNPNFENEAKTAKQLGKIMENPVAALKSEDKVDRYNAAVVMIGKYRNVANPTGRPMKQEPIDAAESALILKALAGGDWTPGRFNATIPNPYELFNQLGITQKDGYNPVNLNTQQQIGEAMQKWLDANSGKFVINRLVVDPNAKVAPPVVPQPQPGIGIRPGIRPLPPIQIQPDLPQDLPAPPAPNRDK